MNSIKLEGLNQITRNSTTPTVSFSQMRADRGDYIDNQALLLEQLMIGLGIPVDTLVYNKKEMEGKEGKWFKYSLTTESSNKVIELLS